MSGWEVKTIIVGYDGSEGAERAVELAQEVAQIRKATVVVLTAFPHLSRVIEGAVESDEVSHDIEQAGEEAASAVARLQAAGVNAVPDVAEGPAAHALLEAAESRGADLIIVGSRGHNRLANLLLGSTSEDVVRRATVPVLVAR
jgi:nucleotide-binding universal stress UspA family protein